MDAPGTAELQAIIQRIINLSVGVAFIILTIMLIVAGIKFLTSGGEQKAIEGAKSTITWAILGIVFMAIAWIILLLVEAFTGVKVTQFCIGFDC